MFYKKIILILPIFAIGACSEIPGITITNPISIMNPNSQAQITSNDFQGIWEGRGYQYNTSQSWTIRVIIVGNQSKIEYPSLRCGGDLIPLTRTADKIEYRERITYGSCVNNGKTVITKLNENTVKFDWFEANGSKGAEGTLTRK